LFSATGRAEDKTMKCIVLGLFVLSARSLCAADTNDFAVVMVGGQTLTNAYVSHFDATYAWIYQRMGGGGKFKLSDLPVEVQERCHYDPVKSAQALADESARQTASRTQSEARKIAQAFDSFIVTFTNDVKGTINWVTKKSMTLPSDFSSGSLEATEFESSAPLVKPFPKSVTLTISDTIGTATHGEYAKKDLTIAWDETRTNLHHLEQTSDPELESLGMWSFAAPLSFDHFKGIAFAKSVKAQLGNVQFDLPYPDREAMRAFVNYFDWKQKSATNGPAAAPATRH
jgi:hypothetical protein